MKDLIVTLDAGTTGLKCSVFSADGAPVCACTAAYGVNYPAEGWAEQTAEQFYAAAAEALGQLRGQFDPAKVAVIGLSGTMNGCLPVEKDGTPLCPNIIHADTRAAANLSEITRAVDKTEYYSRTGNRVDVHYTLPKLLWLREHRPEILKKADCILNTKDAIYGFLTGNFHRTDYSDASLTGMFRQKEKKWDTELLEELGLPTAVLPEIVCSHNTDGRLTASAAALLGLPEGTPVSMGAGDGTCATHGAGVSHPGQAYCNLGSSAWLALMSDTPADDPQQRVFHFADMDGEHTTVCGTVQCGAAAFDWAMRSLFLGHNPEGADFAQVEALAGQAPAGSHGLFFLPTLMGERTPWWDPDARGAMIGMTCSHTRSDAVRAVFEGVTQALHQCGAVMGECGMGFETLSLIGGGAKSGIWPQIFADAFCRPVTVPADPRSATSLGAAAAAGVGVGIFRDYDDAAAHISAAKQFIPDEKTSRVYGEHFEVYRQLYGQLCEAYHAISRYQEKTHGTL